jgi:alkanesulfonate monooxygenase SsuD/methylene tetrahydromethanopterin reductase-like flavin-dependent oxidoreductase (luciferase family)
MRIGLINELHGRPHGPNPAPTWETIKARAAMAESAGFDTFVFEDSLLYRRDEADDGCWDSVSIAAALAAVTDRIQLGQSVLNSPYRSPALTAKIADTIDEISNGRYVLGIGAGNTADSDYEAFGFPTDKRYSRFSEAIQIIHQLLKTGHCDFEGEFYSARNSSLVLRGPRPQGPPINIAAGGPKMLMLTAQYADAWNWWGYDETVSEMRERLTPIVSRLDTACEEVGRDPSSLERTLDVYTVVPEGLSSEGAAVQNPIKGTSASIAEQLLELGAFGVAEVRCDLWPNSLESVQSMERVTELVHAG